MLEQLLAYKNKGNPLKQEWEKFIDDKTIPLDKRWEAFLEAPEEWKDDVMTTQPYECLEAIGLDSPYDDLLIERYETHDVDQDVEHVESMIGDENYNDQLSEEHIVQMKEEIIANRMGSWTFDW